MIRVSSGVVQGFYRLYRALIALGRGSVIGVLYGFGGLSWALGRVLDGLDSGLAGWSKGSC